MMNRKNDIQVKGNSIGGRQGWEYICNSGEVPVLKADLDKKQEYEEYQEFGNVRIVWDYRGTESFKTCQLAKNSCHGDTYWELSSAGCCLSGSFGFYDAMESIEDANTPIVRKGQIVAIASFSKESKIAYLQHYKINGRVDINCQTVAKFEKLTDEEMQEVVKTANRWCNRV